MPYCPECKYEYRTGVSMCPDCNVRLLDKLPAAVAVSGSRVAMRPDDSWVRVCTVTGELKSELAKGALDSNNIPSVVVSSRFSAYGGSTGFAMAQMPAMAGNDVLLVPREYRREAELILEAVLGEDYNQMDIDNV